MRLIDADVCLSKLKPYSLEDENWYVTGGTSIRLIHNAVNNTPTIDPLDALGICQCKDCIHSGIWEEDNIFSHCYYWEYEEGMSPNVVELDGFCSNAVRRKENNNV